MNSKIPAEAQRLIRAELDADSPEYRDTLPKRAPAKVNRGPSPLLTLRIPADVLESLTALAETNDMPVSTLARTFILDGLAARRGEDLRAALERLERDLAEVKARALAS